MCIYYDWSSILRKQQQPLCEKFAKKTRNMPSSCDLPVLFGLKIGFYWPKNWFSDQKSMILSTNSIKISKYFVKNVFYLHFLQIRKRSINEIHHAPDRWVSIPKRIWSIFTHDFFSYTYFQSSSDFLFDFNFNNPKTSRNSSYLIPIEKNSFFLTPILIPKFWFILLCKYEAF